MTGGTQSRVPGRGRVGCRRRTGRLRGQRISPRRRALLLRRPPVHGPGILSLTRGTRWSGQLAFSPSAERSFFCFWFPIFATPARPAHQPAQAGFAPASPARSRAGHPVTDTRYAVVWSTRFFAFGRALLFLFLVPHFRHTCAAGASARAGGLCSCVVRPFTGRASASSIYVIDLALECSEMLPTCTLRPSAPISVHVGEKKHSVRATASLLSGRRVIDRCEQPLQR